MYYLWMLSYISEGSISCHYVFGINTRPCIFEDTHDKLQVHKMMCKMMSVPVCVSSNMGSYSCFDHDIVFMPTE